MTAPVTVTAADREAGASFWAFLGQHGSAEQCRNGTGFRDTAAAFARHRQQAEAASKAREDALVEALEAIARNNWRDQSRAKQVAREAIMKVYAARAKASSDGGEASASEPATTAQRLTRAFAQHLAGRATVFHLDESAWASITFSGTRHTFVVEPLVGVSFSDLKSAIEDWEPSISGKLLAGAALSEQPDGFRASLLLLEDAA